MNCLSLDVESYGALNSQPVQTCFHPRRCLYVDRPTLPLLTCALTPTTPLAAFSPADLSTLRPTASFVVPLTSLSHLPLTHNGDPAVPSHLIPALASSHTLAPRVSLKLLLRWLAWADVLIGMNLAFDLSFLRAHHPLLRRTLSGRHTLLDLSYINFLECDSRPERSLKTLGPVLSTHSYTPGTSARDHRFRSFSSLAFYNCQDTWNTVLAVAELARRITETIPCPSSSASSSGSSSEPSPSPPTSSYPAASIDPPFPNAKLSPFCISLYSDTIWTCVDMSDAGIPFHIPSLASLAYDLQNKITDAARDAYPDLLLEGTGSNASKKSLLDAAVAEIGPSILADPLLQLTEKKRDLSFSDANRSLLKSRLDPASPLVRLFDLADTHSAAQKLLSSYCYPLLWHKRNDASSRTSLLVPQPGVTPCPVPESPALRPAPSPSENSASLPTNPAASPPAPPPTSTPSSEPPSARTSASSPPPTSPPTPPPTSSAP